MHETGRSRDKNPARRAPTMRASLLAMAAAGLLLSACDDASDSSTGSSSGGSGSTTPTVTPATLSGVVATGAALAGATVSITDAAGTAACNPTGSSLTSSATGQYTCVLASGETGPFLVVATDATGNYAPMASVVTTAPAAGASATVNVSPLTNVVAQQAGVSATGTGAQLVAGIVSAYSAVLANVVAQLAPVAASLGLTNYNPVSTPVTASAAGQAGNAADSMLDVVLVSTDQTTNTPVFKLADGTGTAIPVATATTSSPATVPVPTVSATETAQLSTFNASLAAALNSCFSGTTAAQRVTATNTSLTTALGGSAWTSLGTACQPFGTLLAGGGSVPAYLNNGYTGPQNFLSLLTSTSMNASGSTGGKFQAPLVMMLRPAASSGTGNDLAVINLLFLDVNGNPGNFITTLQYIGGQWALTGNQQPVDVQIKTRMRMVTQLNTATTTGANSHYQSGLGMIIDALGPGSGAGTSASMVSATVTGPGLPGYASASTPGAGIAYIAPDPVNEPGQAYMDRATSITSTLHCGATGSYNCNNYWISRTQSLTNGALGTNPTGVNWDQTGNALADSQAVVAGAVYTVTLHYSDGSTKTVNKILLNDLQQAATGINLPWITLGTNSTALMNPSGSLTGTQASATVDWVLNPLAPQVAYVQASINANGSYGLSLNVDRGATSTVYNPSTLSGSSQTISALAAGTSARYLDISLRTLDNSQREQAYQFDK